MLTQVAEWTPSTLLSLAGRTAQPAPQALPTRIGGFGGIEGLVRHLRDEKIVAVPTPKLTRRYENVHEYTDLPDITLKQIEHFFEHYKDLEPGKWVKVVGWGNAAEAEQMILDAIERAKNTKG